MPHIRMFTRNRRSATWCAALLLSGFLVPFAPARTLACPGGGGGGGGSGGGGGGGGAGGGAMAMAGGRGGGGGGGGMMSGGGGGMMSGMCGSGGTTSTGSSSTASAQSAMTFQARAAQAFQAGAASHRARVAQQRQQIQLVSLKNQRLHALRQAVKSRHEGDFDRLQPGRERPSAQTSFASIGSSPLTRTEVLSARRSAYDSEMHRRRGN